MRRITDVVAKNDKKNGEAAQAVEFRYALAAAEGVRSCGHFHYGFIIFIKNPLGTAHSETGDPRLAQKVHILFAREFEKPRQAGENENSEDQANPIVRGQV